MTITRSASGPLGEPTPGGPGAHGDPGEQIARFRHPLTRNLLAHNGLTTTALEHILATTLNVRVLRQHEVPGRAVADTITAELGLRDSDPALIRHSCLVTPELLTVSVNHVVAVARHAADSGLDDLKVPIGHGLIAHGLSQRRRLVWAGSTSWLDGRPCAARAYIMSLGDHPACYIHEAFDPNVVAPGRTGEDHPPPKKYRQDAFRIPGGIS